MSNENRNNLAVAEIDVKLLQKNLKKIGFDVTDTEGVFGESTKSALTKYQRETNLSASGNIDTSTLSAIKKSVEALSFAVNGVVSSPFRAGVGGLIVRVIDKNVGSDITLAETVTKIEGSYKASFEISSAVRRGKQSPDLQVQVFSREKLIGASEVRYNAPNNVAINVWLTKEANDSLPSEYETLTSTLQAQFKGNLRDLKEKGDRQDVTYLANKTGWDARAVAMAALADQFSVNAIDRERRNRIQPAFFYALFRSGLPANEKTLYQTNINTVKAIWAQSLKGGVIPTALEKEIPAALELFQSLSAHQTLAGQVLVGVSSMKEILSPVLSDLQKQEQFAKLYTQHRNSTTDFWTAVRTSFGEMVEKRLRIDGKLGYLTLNNAPLMKKIHENAHSENENYLTDTLHLVENGYYQTEKWRQLLADTPIPKEIPGESIEKKRAYYAELMANQVRLSYPTATIAQMVKRGETKVAEGLADGVHQFLSKYHEEFLIGVQPVEQFIARKKLTPPSEVVEQVKRIQRVYQISPSDQAMNSLLKRDIDSAYAVTRYSRDEFIRTFKDELGGEEQALVTYAKSLRVHNAVLNITTTYLIARMAPQIGLHSSEGFMNPSPNAPDPQTVNASDVIAYPTLEKLFGELDYCECEECRSILSPAAYLVDLLDFCNRKVNYKKNPVDVLFSRRPDIQYLPLTCKNTNTPLPYIDVVNETIEYFVANNLKLDNYQGHSVDETVIPSELLASPQFVVEKAYRILSGEPPNVGDDKPVLPPSSLPFHEPLENLRLFFDAFGVPLQEVMKTLRKDDSTERASPDGYGWRDILMEELRLSRAEYKLLTDRSILIQQLYGFSQTTDSETALDELTRVKPFTRRVNITYEDIIGILKTRFVNPNSTLLPKLQKLGVTISAIKRVIDDKNAGRDTSWFDNAVIGVNTGPYGGDIKGWLTSNYANIMGLITVANPIKEDDLGSFDKLEFRYAKPDNGSNTLREFEFVRLIRFIRLWKKLGWTIDETDRAIIALYPSSQIPNDPSDAVNLERLDNGFLTLLPRLGIIKDLLDSLNLSVKKDLAALLACFASIDTNGTNSLYRQMFLSLSPSKQNEAFIDKGNGEFLADKSKLLQDYSEVLRGAFSLTDNELNLISASLGFDQQTVLTLENVSAIFRRGWLSRKLKLSVREFLLLTKFAGIDPFSAPDPPNPPIVTLVKFIKSIRALSIKPVQALYLIWNQDISGKSVPPDNEITRLGYTLRSTMTSIEKSCSVTEDPTGQIARVRMAMVYGNETTDIFFGLIDNTFVTSVPYVHDADELKQEIITAGQSRIVYDSFRRQLLFYSVMTESACNALKSVQGVTPEFKAAVDALYVENQKLVGSFFIAFPELQSLYDKYVASNDPAEKKRTDMLANFLPEFLTHRKRQNALETVSASQNIDIDLANALLDNPKILHAASNTSRPILDDLIALENTGLLAEFFFKDTVAGVTDMVTTAEAELAYSATGSKKLPANPDLGKPISGVWSGYLQVPENASYNFRIATDPNAKVELTVDQESLQLILKGNDWITASPLELTSGSLHFISIKVEKVKDELTVTWETTGNGWGNIPASHLYSRILVDNLREAYTRFLKAATLMAGLELTTHELAYLAAHDDYKINGFGWMNFLAISSDPDSATSSALFKTLNALLDFALVKADISPNGEQLLALLKDPKAVNENDEPQLNVITQWDATSLSVLLKHYGVIIDNLAHFGTFFKIYDAYLLVKKLGISASALLKANTNEPYAITIREVEQALRARYDENDWLNVLKPINDEMRDLRRDALVCYVLHQMSLNPDTEHIDTPDKLFEYFLMDVEMEPSMLTSRIRHALSSVQLFIERCLMNLEPEVSPLSINADFWEWMKRYRVWEANRRVFLYPESWLEPELRDDMSPFFKEMMSELLQSDITEDKAAIALSNYLSKLEEVAKLEPCGIYNWEGDPGTADDVEHIVARTPGANRKYFYRQKTASWMPWEQIKLDIEDNPVLPVVWKDRLFLFWLKIIKQAPVSPKDQDLSVQPGSDKSVNELNLSDIKNDAKNSAEKNTRVNVLTVLCWSEFYQGKWQPIKTSNPDKPSFLESYIRERDFDRSTIQLSSETFGSEESGDEYLQILVKDTKYQVFTFFKLYNTHSLPIRLEDDIPMSMTYYDVTVRIGPYRSIAMDKNTLKILYGSYTSKQKDPPLERLVLNTIDNNALCRVIEPLHDLQNPWDAPFFLEDKHHVFYVTTTHQSVSLPNWDSIIFVNEVFSPVVVIPEVVLKKPPPLVAPKIPLGPVDGTDPRVINVSPIERFVSEDAYINKGIGNTNRILYDGVEIGLRGAINQSQSLRIQGGREE